MLIFFVCLFVCATFATAEVLYLAMRGLDWGFRLMSRSYNPPGFTRWYTYRLAAVSSAIGCAVALAGTLSGCYLSHGRERPPGPVPAVCPAESPDPVVRYEDLGSGPVTHEAGTRRSEIASFRLTELVGADVEYAEYPYRVAALMGSLTTPEGGPVFTRMRLLIEERTGELFGPDVIATGSEVVEGELWDSSLLRAGRSVTATLVLDIAPDAVAGTYEFRLGNECDLTPRMWFVPEDGPTVEMPTDRIGGNEPITVRVTVVPRGEE